MGETGDEPLRRQFQNALWDLLTIIFVEYESRCVECGLACVLSVIDKYELTLYHKCERNC